MSLRILHRNADLIGDTPMPIALHVVRIYLYADTIRPPDVAGVRMAAREDDRRPEAMVYVLYRADAHRKAGDMGNGRDAVFGRVVRRRGRQKEQKEEAAGQGRNLRFNAHDIAGGDGLKSGQYDRHEWAKSFHGIIGSSEHNECKLHRAEVLLELKAAVNCDKYIERWLGEGEQRAVLSAGPAHLWNRGGLVAGQRPLQPARQALIEEQLHP